jgi:integrase
MHLLQFYENLQEEGIRADKKEGGLSAKTIQHHHRLLSVMFSHAVDWKMISENPAKIVKPPKVEQKDIEFYDEEQIMKLIDVLNNAPVKYMLMVMVAIFTGIRRGELMGLTWDDVIFDDKTISINKASQYIRRKGISMKAPKTKFSKRKIMIPDFLIDLLKAYKTIQQEDRLKIETIYEKYEHKGFVFAQDNGKPMHPDTISQWFAEFIKKNNLPHITFHGLRHSHATILLANNTDIVSVSRRLGHEKASTTINIYGHPIEKSENIISEKLGRILKKTSQN